MSLQGRPVFDIEDCGITRKASNGSSKCTVTKLEERQGFTSFQILRKRVIQRVTHSPAIRRTTFDWGSDELCDNMQAAPTSYPVSVSTNQVGRQPLVFLLTVGLRKPGTRDLNSSVLCRVPNASRLCPQPQFVQGLLVHPVKVLPFAVHFSTKNREIS